MSQSYKASLVAAAMALSTELVAFAGSVKAQEQLTAAEKIYADLAKLSPAERQRQLEAGAAKENRFNFINHSGPRGTSIVKSFVKRYPFISESNIDAPNLNAPSSAERLYAEETAGRHLTDAIITAAPLDFREHFAKHLIAHYPTPANDGILPRYKQFMDPENRWIVYNMEELGISYNTNLLKPEDAPKAWADLCNPKYKGQVTFDDPAEEAYLAGLWTIFGEEESRKLIECIGKNSPILQRGHAQRLLLMLAGDHWIQGDNFLYRGDLEHKKAVANGNPSAAPFQAVYEAPIMASALVGVINANTPHPYTAALMMDWLLSDTVQEVLLKDNKGVPTQPHPFVPESATLVATQMPPKDVIDRLHDYWARYVGNAK